MFLFFITANIILAYYYLFSVLNTADPFARKLVLVCLWTSVQILFTILILGILGLLDPFILSGLNVLVSVSIFLKANKTVRKLSGAVIQDDALNITSIGKSLLSPESLFLIFLLLILIPWYTLASFLLPPRGVDDLGYHLPAAYEFVLQKRIFLLPLELRSIFAFPFNADLFFVWAVIFTHTTDWIGLVPFCFTLMGTAVTYALARDLAIEQKTALFVSLLFIFSPLVLAQSGSAYIDSIVAVFFMTGLYFSIQYYRNGSVLNLFSAAASMGLLLGMKYSTLLPILALQWPIFIRWSKKKNFRDAALYILIILMLGGYWYIRNFIVLGNPLFPMDLSQRGGGIFIKQETVAPIQNLLNIPRKLEKLFILDIGIGSFHGGFGVVFWGMALPSWIFWTVRFLRDKGEDRVVKIFLSAQFFLWLGLLLFVPLNQLYLCGRYSIALIPLGMIFLGFTLDFFTTAKSCRTTLVILCCLSSVFSLILLAAVRLPHYKINLPISDILAGKNSTKNKYLKFSSFIPAAKYDWDILDRLTINDPTGLTVYMASDTSFFWPAPTYGNRLQNRIWNFRNDIRHAPDAFLHQKQEHANLLYLREKIPVESILLDPRYELISDTGSSSLVIRSDRVQSPEQQRILADFYFENLQKIDDVPPMAPYLNFDIPVLASSGVGHILKYQHLTGQLKNPIHLLTKEMGYDKFTRSRNLMHVYSLDRPVAGCTSKKIYESQGQSMPFSIFENNCT